MLRHKGDDYGWIVGFGNCEHPVTSKSTSAPLLKKHEGEAASRLVQHASGELFRRVSALGRARGSIFIFLRVRFAPRMKSEAARSLVICQTCTTSMYFIEISPEWQL